MEKYCISVDWLQTYCLGNEIVSGRYSDDEFNFDVQLKNTETAQFKRLYTVKSQDMEIATIQQEPRTTVINKRATLIKLSNRVLYSQLYIKMLYSLQRVLKLTYKGITRLDICYDCNKFSEGRSVPRFIKNFVQLPMGEKGSIYRRGSDRFAAYGNKSRTSDSKITSIRFGSEKSRIGAYMYDKTIELREVKDKPWIREMWAENGLISDDKQHVWRSEISIKCEGMDVLNMSSGELFKLAPVYLEHYKSIEKLFHIYAGKVFDFRICNGQKNKKNYDVLKLFECDCDITSKPYYVSKSADTGRMEKICYNKLQSLSREYVDLSEQRRVGLITAMDFLQELSGLKSRTLHLKHYEQYLNNFYAKKYIDFDDRLYLYAMEAVREQKIDVDPHELYNNIVTVATRVEYDDACIQSLIDCVGYIP